jgi:hypothetical protein
MNYNKKKYSPIKRVNSVNKFLSPKYKNNEHDINISTPKLEKRNVSKYESDEFSELSYNPYDDYKTIVKKNSELIKLVIKAYSSLKEIVTIHK